MNNLDVIIRELVIKHGQIWVDEFETTEDSEINDLKEEAMEKILNAIDHHIDTEVVSKMLLDEMVVFITSFCKQKFYSMEEVIQSFTHLIDSTYFQDYQKNLNKEDLYDRLNWEGIFEKLVKNYMVYGDKGVVAF